MGRLVIDLAGKRFGSRVVLRRLKVEGERRAYFLCQCDCGKEKVVAGRDLRRGTAQSCGCLYKGKHNFKHGDAKGHDATKEYRCWCKMGQRCYNRNNKSYKDYGGRGIRVCQGFRKTYLPFLSLVGRAPTPEHSIDRINNDGHYSCGRCSECKRRSWKFNIRWATPRQQNNNQRKQKVV